MMKIQSNDQDDVSIEVNSKEQTFYENTSKTIQTTIQDESMESDQTTLFEERVTQSTDTSTARFYLRTCEREGELGVTNFAELQKLYHSGFIAPEDEIRRTDSASWQKAGAMFELRTVQPRRWLEGNEFALLAALICVLTLTIIFFFR